MKVVGDEGENGGGPVAVERLYMTWLADDLESADTTLLYTFNLTTDEDVFGVASNGNDGIVFLIGQNVDHIVTAVRVNSNTGAIENTNVLQSGNDGSGLDFKKRAAPGASIAWDEGTDTVAVILAEGFLSAAHQGAKSFMLDGTTLELGARGFRSMASHNAGLGIFTRGDGKFIASEFGDNFPRGILIHHMDSDGNKVSEIVYEVKAEHTSFEGHDASLCDEYKGFSFFNNADNVNGRGERTYCKQTNDNDVYGACLLDVDWLLTDQS